MREKTAVNLALHWLAHSDIYHDKGPQIAQGGVSQGYNWREHSYPFVYSEITGYAISAFVNAYRWTNEEGYLALAQQSADFLLGLQSLVEEDDMHGAIPHGLTLPGLELRRRYYSFDAAMCLQGLLDLDAVRPSPTLKKSACAIGDWLLNRMQQDNGAFLSMYDVDAGTGQHADDDEFSDGGCLHAKHAIGLLKLSRVTDDERYTLAAKRVCNWVLELQDNDGAFRATERLKQVVAHPHCYATEGLLFAYSILGTECYLKAARQAGEWLSRAQNRDGSINIAYKRQWWRMGRRITEVFFPRRVTDATAQAIRIWLVLYCLDGDQRFLDACHRAKTFLHRMQCTSSQDQNAVGGFYFWPGHPIMFAWCTMFATHALYALERAKREESYQPLMMELF